MSQVDLSAALPELLDRVHLARGEDLPVMLADATRHFGVDEISVFLVDYTQRVLVQLPAEGEDERDEVSVEGSLAGRSYRSLSVVRTSDDDRTVLWAPLLDGAERLGVLKAVVSGAPDEEFVRSVTALASLTAEILMTRSAYGDAIERTRRRMPMSIAAEMQWHLLPPLTYATPEVVVAGALEPCYDIGGDSFDYAVNGHILHAALFDAVGHGIEAAQVVTLVTAGYRNARRSGLNLDDTATSIDRWVSMQFPDSFVTGVLLELDTGSGEVRAINAGHPPVMLFRAQKHIKTMPGPTRPPFGLGTALGAHTEQRCATEHLERGDHLLLHSDGITEARGPDGEEFGLDRLADFLSRHLTAAVPAPETMRRLVHQLLEHQQETLQDDATALLIAWSRLEASEITP
jgi:hypothetical protein